MLHLVILNNLESINAELIKLNISQTERLIRLNNSAKKQMEILSNNKSIKELKILEGHINDDTIFLVHIK